MLSINLPEAAHASPLQVGPTAIDLKDSKAEEIAKTIARLICSLFGKSEAWDEYEKKSLCKAIARADFTENQDGTIIVDSRLGKFEIEHNRDTNTFILNYGRVQIAMDIVGDSITSFKQLQAQCNNYLSLIKQGTPDRHTASMLLLRNAIDTQDMDKVEAGIAAFKESVQANEELKHANIEVTCNSAGHLVLAAHLAYNNDSNTIIEIGTIKENFYNDVDKNSDDNTDELIEVNLSTKTDFARNVQNWINEVSPKTVGSWKVQNFFDLACQYNDGDFDSIKPDFHLDLLGSAESTKKFNKSTDEEIDHEYHNKPPVLFKTDSQLGTVNKAYAVEGPSGLFGDRFDANVIEGFCVLLNRIAEGDTNLHISGHSRGGVEAIAINNLLVLLKNASNKEGFNASNFIENELTKIKPDPDDFRPDHLKDRTVEKLIADAITNSKKLLNVKIGLTLSDPVQGPDHTVFYHKAFDLSKTLMLNEEMHSRVDITISSSQSAPVGFDLHLPEVELKEDSEIKLTITKVNCSHGSMIKELYRKKSNDGGYNGKETGSFEGHSAASALSGRPIQAIEKVQAIKGEQSLEIVAAYVTRGSIYAAGSMIEEKSLQNIGGYNVSNFLERSNVRQQVALQAA